jgi:histidinol-phosphate aminotransferase
LIAPRIEPQPGLDWIKTYVPGKPIEEVQRELGIHDVVKLASNENPFGSSSKALAAIQEALQRLNQYPDGQSYYLRHALAARLGVGPETITVGNGADGIIVETCLAYLDEESDVIVGECSFPVYDIYVHTMRARLVRAPMKDYRLDLDAMVERISDRTKLIFVCNPNNPTGTIVSASEVAAFMDRVPDHVLVIFDEAYYEFIDSDDYPETLRYLREGRQNVMIVRTFSKVYGLAGIRLGYAITHPEVLGPLHKVKEPFAVNLLAQAAGLAALEDDEFLQESVASNHAGRLYLYREFDRLGLPYLKSHTNFVLVQVGPQAGETVKRLMAKGLIVRPCGGYGIPEFLRVTVGTQAQNERLIREWEAILAEVPAPHLEAGGGKA